MKQKTWASHLKPGARPQPSWNSLSCTVKWEECMPSFCVWVLTKPRGQVSSSGQRALGNLFPPSLCPCMWALGRGQRWILRVLHLTFLRQGLTFNLGP